MSTTYGIGEAKTQLSKLVDLAEEGEETVLRRGRKPVVRRFRGWPGNLIEIRSTGCSLHRHFAS